MPSVIGALSGLLVAAALTPSASSRPAAYPIDPVPLRELCRLAELVVLAEVVDAQAGTIDLGGWHATVAELRVTETWLGACDGTIRVSYLPELSCPEPASFPQGERVLAFLAWDDDDQTWTSVALSYGTRFPTDAELPAWRRAVSEWQQLPARASLAGRSGPETDWVVARIEAPATRDEGLLDLGLESWRRGDADRRRDNKSPRLRLTDEHMRRLSAVLREPLPAPDADAGVRTTLSEYSRRVSLLGHLSDGELVRDHRAPAVTRAALALLDDPALASVPPRALLLQLSARFDDPILDALAAEEPIQGLIIPRFAERARSLLDR